MATKKQRERARIYRDVAMENSAASFVLYEEQKFAQANFLSGLAVECILRAFRHMMDPAFDSRHDLDRLFEIAKFSQAVEEDEVRKASMKMGVVILLWSNDHRFLSENALRRKFKRMRLDRGIRGDFLKELTRKLVSASQDLVTIGVRQWNSSYEN